MKLKKNKEVPGMPKNKKREKKVNKSINKKRFII